MVFFVLAEFALESTLWITKQIFYLGNYIIWGRSLTPQEIMMETLTEMKSIEYNKITEIERQQLEILNRLKALENSINANGSTKKTQTTNTYDD